MLRPGGHDAALRWSDADQGVGVIANQADDSVGVRGFSTTLARQIQGRYARAHEEAHEYFVGCLRDVDISRVFRCKLRVSRQ
jgi:hypothetical protein